MRAGARGGGCSQRLSGMLRLVLVLAVVGASGVCAWAGDSGESSDHDRARQALLAGEILPLTTVLERIAREMPGQVMEVELERRGERWVYEVKVLRSGGALVKLLVDARDGTILGNRERKSGD